ncbi:hypothetical protein Y032_0446g1604 [Ancylostoma ceylanicum]|uniref:Uncharacterized protein n=1 Tax=Ancylostoma ceylanicum TaxID=53326 RepID=A0A016WZ11_9BILA|nr:hypothetical protein Y032_0446g1604 [Ancylostoma ceylanicum]
MLVKADDNQRMSCSHIVVLEVHIPAEGWDDIALFPHDDTRKGIKDKVVGVDQSVGCATHSTSSEHRRGVECVCALYSDLRWASDAPS